MTEQLTKPINLIAAFVQTLILAVAWIDTIDIFSRIIATVVSVIASLYLIIKFKRETEVAKTRKKREEIELEMKEAELAQMYLKSKRKV